MSDDEDVHYVKRQKVVHFGSLANDMGASQGQGQGEQGPANVHKGDEYLPLEREGQDEQEGEQDIIIKEMERRKRAR